MNSESPARGRAGHATINKSWAHRLGVMGALAAFVLAIAACQSPPTATPRSAPTQALAPSPPTVPTPPTAPTRAPSAATGPAAVTVLHTTDVAGYVDPCG